MRTRNIVLAIVMVGQVALPAAPLAGQEEGREEPLLWRQWVFGAVGLVVGGLPMLLADGQAETPWCEGATCAALTTGLLTGGVGYLIGRDRDENVLERWELGASLEREAKTARLALPASRLVAHPDGGALVIGRWGLSIVDAELSAVRAGGHIRGVRDVAAIPERNALIAATVAGIYRFPLRNTAAESTSIGQRLFPDPVTALALLPSRGLIAGAANSVKLLQRRDGANGPKFVEAVHALVSDTVGDAAYAAVNGSVWTLEGRRLQARAAETLEPLGSIELPAAGGELVVDGAIAAYAAGSDGVFLVDIAEPRKPQLIAKVPLDALHFALDAALRDDLLYVAGGAQGLVVMDIGDPAHPLLLGVVRGIGSVDEVVAGRDGVLVLDRKTHQVRHVRIMEPGPAPAH